MQETPTAGAGRGASYSMDSGEKESYEDEPVYWCRACMSLRVMDGGGSWDYCGQCGSTDIAVGGMEEWEAERGRRGE